ncbi:uncharacterized protein LOC129922855 isoform X1 [Biomphalaria glabrata]|uniref:Uncharacterized protein LOC129922855 isoform X1 n=1 Tax=Biomphalaria glabrata TaxID=6526 RepID=A0A9W2YV64_BIOGL|nr:uncharacterized protein LOC129922855 isoform X1 [Biomphalaria glabrata]
MIPGTYKLKLVDGTVRDYPLACVSIESDYIVGKYVVACFKDPVADLILGNVDINVSQEFDCAAVTRSAKDRENDSGPVNECGILEDCRDVLGTSDDFLCEQLSDPSLKDLWERHVDNCVDNKKNGSVEYKVFDRLLYRVFRGEFGEEERQLVVPSAKREIVLKTAHESMLAGHLSLRKTKSKIYKYFFWQGLDRDIKEFVRSCDICQKARVPRRCDRVELGQMNVVTTPFYKVATDIIGPLEITDNKNRYILTVVDVATRWPEAIPLRNINTETVIEALTNIFCRIGLPIEILSDQGPQFTSELYKQVCEFFSVKPVHSTIYHPSSNGMIERLNSTLKSFLRKVCQDSPHDWDRKVSAALFAYREVPNETMGLSPFELVYGRQMRGPLAILKQVFVNAEEETEYKNVFTYLVDLKQRLSEVTSIAKSNSDANKKKYKMQYDKYSSRRDINEGDCVLVLKPHRDNKLSVFWQGPYKVVNKISKFNYVVEKENKIKVYHINRLMKYHCRVREVSNSNVETEDTNELLSANMVSVVGEEEVDEQDGENEDVMANIPTLEIRSEEMSGGNVLTQVKINPDLNAIQKKQVDDILSEFKDIISDIPGRAKVEEFKIKLVDTKPVTLKPYAVPIHLRDKVKQEIDSMLDLGIIGPTDSPYAAPVVIIKKKDGTLRPCIDFRKLNNVTEIPAEVIPEQEDLFNMLYKAKYFTLLDLTKGYWQIPICETSKPFTAFRVLGEHYMFHYLPFGLSGAPNHFNKIVKRMLRGLENVLFYFDDICIFSEDWDRHIESVRNVFSALRKNGFTLKPAKLDVGFTNVKFLGHSVGQGVVKPDHSNVKKILEFKTPSTKKELRGLIGLINYYSRFIPKHADLVFPFTELLRRGKSMRVDWSCECAEALKRVQACLCKYPILRLPDFSIPFYLQTDASDKGISGILSQCVNGMLHPIKFVSRKLLPREQKYSIIEREGLAIVYAIKKLDRYLAGKKFHLQTDHKALSYLRSTNFTNARITRWALMLQDYSFDVVHVKGEDNLLADLCSRLL